MKRTSAFAILVIFLGLAIGPVSCGGGDDDDADGGDDDDSSDDDDDQSDDDGDSSDDDDDMSDDDDDDSAADDDSDDDVWVDVTSEYAWQTQAPDTAYIWEDAKKHCDDLSLGGHDDWRLPSISELRSLVRGCPGIEPDGACGVRDACRSADCYSAACDSCEILDGPGPEGCYWPSDVSGVCGYYWSSSETEGVALSAWGVRFDQAWIRGEDTPSAAYARCVRTWDAKSN